MKKTDRIYIAGHRGLAGSGIWRHLEAEGYQDLVGLSSRDLDLTNRPSVFEAMRAIKPGVVIDAAARVGGIHANDTYPADFLSQNLQIQVNLMDAAHDAGVDRLLFLGSACIYPKFAPQPIPESALLTGALEETNDAYGIAKIAGIIQVQAVRRQHGRNWISAMPTNLYGPNDNFHPENSHVLAALIRRFHDAKKAGVNEVFIWGTGAPTREFMHVDDLASAVQFLLQNYDEPETINLGTGVETSIQELAHLVAEAVGFEGKITNDTNKPDGTPKRMLDTTRLRAMGWAPRWNLRDGIGDAYQWFTGHADSLRAI